MGSYCRVIISVKQLPTLCRPSDFSTREEPSSSPCSSSCDKERTQCPRASESLRSFMVCYPVVQLSQLFCVPGSGRPYPELKPLCVSFHSATSRIALETQTIIASPSSQLQSVIIARCPCLDERLTAREDNSWCQGMTFPGASTYIHMYDERSRLVSHWYVLYCTVCTRTSALGFQDRPCCASCCP